MLAGVAACLVLVAVWPALAQDAPSLLDAPPQAIAVAPEQRTGVLLRTVVGLLSLLTLAYLGGHRRVQALEERLGLSQAVAAGLPFIALGAIARHPSVGVLTDGVMSELGPLLRFALGWLGFLAGFRFDFGAAGERTRQSLPHNVRQSSPRDVLPSLPHAPRASLDHADPHEAHHERLSALPFRLRAPHTLTMFTLATGRAAIAFVVTGAAMAIALFAIEGFRVDLLGDPTFYRDASLFGIAGALASGAPRPAAEHAEVAHAEAARTRAMVLRRVQDVVGVVGLLLVTSYFRFHDGVAFWQLPGTAWLLLALGLGTAIGFVAYAVLARAKNADADAMVLLLGSVAFAAGIAGYLRLSPLVVCFLAGLIVANLPGGRQRTTLVVLERLERPIYLLFLVVAGALAQGHSAAGWLLMVAFVVMRLAGQTLGLAWARRNGVDPHDTQSALESPMGALSIAVVVSAQVRFAGGALPLLTTAVLGGVLIGEILSQVAARVRTRGARPPAPAAAGDEESEPRTDASEPVRKPMESLE